MARAATLALLTMTLAVVIAPASAEGQGCGLAAPGASVSASVGGASYEVAGGLSGVSIGADAGYGGAMGSLGAAYRTIRLDGDNPHIGRLSGAVPVPVALGATTVCAVGHAGIASLTVLDETSTVLAGGAGLRVAGSVAMAGGSAVPYAELRGLGARSGGRLLGTDMDATGFALGGGVGVRAAFGRITIAGAAFMDGFARGLGLTPYPSRTVELGLGVRF